MSQPLVHPLIKDNWFKETSTLWPGQSMTLEVKEILHDVLVFESTNYGNVLVLDGVIQCTERDEFSYQEMITHLPMNSHPNPKKVLVIGGGDGGVLREVVKHESVEEVVLCEIDETHPKVKVHIGDGFPFLESHTSTYDVIITDSSDPVGPAESLYQSRYYELMKNALTPGGIISTQGECQWLHLPLIKEVKDFSKKLFPVVEYAYTTIPTYPSGQIGFIMCSNDASRNLKEPVRQWPKDVENKLCRYYNSDIHRAAFVLPTFVRNAL
ncbi:putrescine aminopropyltransferase [Entomophthora muscae]|uniref:Putrescine aminopropyltransferase n=1 Tax=Entomophthora muscae TaxID=34485 RepID=A0ACC2TXW8_9FUNG|nr:putrescine aminopropyltransferase [Entomophthora muscae]